MFHFFFFKQKTAYEMVGSDWSSDVCSSDLDADVAIDAGRRVEDGARHEVVPPRLEIGRASCRERVLPTVEILVVGVALKKKKCGESGRGRRFSSRLIVCVLCEES